MFTAGKKHNKKYNKTKKPIKNNKKSLKQRRKTLRENKKLSLINSSMEEIQKAEIKPEFSLTEKLKDKKEEIKKSLKPKKLKDIPSEFIKTMTQNDSKFFKSTSLKSLKKTLLPIQVGGGNGDILTYHQNNLQNDVTHDQLATRQMFSEQTK